jgi:hypothetical protein
VKMKSKKTKIEPAPSPANDPADISTQVDTMLKKAALEGAEQILKMINDPEVSDASRLAAAKWAVERVNKDKSPEDASVSLSSLMEIVRQMRSQAQTGPAPAIALQGEAAKPSEPANYDQWIDSNLKH